MFKFKFPSFRVGAPNSDESNDTFDDGKDDAFKEENTDEFADESIDRTETIDIKMGLLGLGTCGYRIVDKIYDKCKLYQTNIHVRTIDYDDQIKKPHFRKTSFNVSPMGGDFIKGEKELNKIFQEDRDELTRDILRQYFSHEYNIVFTFFGGGGGSGCGMFRGLLKNINKDKFSHLISCTFGPFSNEDPSYYFNIAAWIGRIDRIRKNDQKNNLITGVYVDNDHLISEKNKDLLFCTNSTDRANINFIKYIKVIIESQTYDKTSLGQFPRYLGILKSRYEKNQLFPLSVLGYSSVHVSGNDRFDMLKAFDEAINDINYIRGKIEIATIFVIIPLLFNDKYIHELRDNVKDKYQIQVNGFFIGRDDTKFIEMVLLGSGKIVPIKLYDIVLKKVDVIEERIEFFADQNPDANELVEEARKDLDAGIEYIRNILNKYG